MGMKIRDCGPEHVSLTYMFHLKANVARGSAKTSFDQTR